jgi:hypothetical protein
MYFVLAILFIFDVECNGAVIVKELPISWSSAPFGEPLAVETF